LKGPSYGGLIRSKESNPDSAPFPTFGDRDRPTCTSEAGLVAAPPIAPRCERYRDQ